MALQWSAHPYASKGERIFCILGFFREKRTLLSYVYPSQRIYLVLRKVVSAGFGVPFFIPLVHRMVLNIYFEGALYGSLQRQNGRWYVSVRYKNWLENRPAKPREVLLRKGMRWLGNGSFCRSIPAVWIWYLTCSTRSIGMTCRIASNRVLGSQRAVLSRKRSCRISEINESVMWNQ